jgi:hypothetical protein
MRTSLIALLMHSALLAQSPIAVASVTDTLTGEARLAPGSRALVRLTRAVSPDSLTVEVEVSRQHSLVVAKNVFMFYSPWSYCQGQPR